LWPPQRPLPRRHAPAKLQLRSASRSTPRKPSTARGTDAQPFEIETVKIEAALLSGTKVYRVGRREPFEGAFMIRSDRAGPDDPFTTRRGIGVLVDAPAGTGIIGNLHAFLKKD
jgi:hypothetical protein